MQLPKSVVRLSVLEKSLFWKVDMEQATANSGRQSGSVTQVIDKLVPEYSTFLGALLNLHAVVVQLIPPQDIVIPVKPIAAIDQTQLTTSHTANNQSSTAVAIAAAAAAALTAVSPTAANYYLQHQQPPLATLEIPFQSISSPVQQNGNQSPRLYLTPDSPEYQPLSRSSDSPLSTRNYSVPADEDTCSECGEVHSFTEVQRAASEPRQDDVPARSNAGK